MSGSRDTTVRPGEVIELRSRAGEEGGVARRPVGPRLRRRLMVGAAGIGLAALLAFAPSWVATTGAYLALFPRVHAADVAWRTSTHADAACLDCHVRPGLLAGAVDRVRMSGAVYATAVAPSRAASAFADPTNAACLACHSDLRTVSPTGDLKIPHRAHVEILGMACVRCHGYVVHEKSPAGNHNPPMSACLSCHDGDTARSSCSTCHTEKDAPPSHTAADWLRAHGAQSSDPACAKCHKWADDWCADCHSQRPRSHGKDWRAVHGDAVELHRSCEACHTASFCVRCHGVVPKAGFDPSLKLVR